MDRPCAARSPYGGRSAGRCGDWRSSGRWRLLARLFDNDEQPSLEAASVAIVDDLGLPTALLDPSVSVDTIVQRFPDLAAELRITTLRDQARELVPVLVREAGRTFLASLAAVDRWTPPWSAPPVPVPVGPASAPSGPVVDLLAGHPGGLRRGGRAAPM
jgi:hypothetical protein